MAISWWSMFILIQLIFEDKVLIIAVVLDSVIEFYKALYY